MKRILAVMLCVCMIAAVSAGCGQDVVSSGTTDIVKSSDAGSGSSVSSQVNTTVKSTEPLLDINDVPAQNLDAADAEYQKKAPVAGEEVAILHTSMGDISFKFFPEVAPKAVNNFIALAKAGRYDGTIFHRVINNFMIQGGDYTNFDGTGGVSAYGESFGYEVSDYLSNCEGAVAMAHSSLPDSNGSQFYINQVNNNHLDGDYTVFGQVYDGMDVVNTIAGVETVSDRPTTDVVLTSVEITTYSE